MNMWIILAFISALFSAGAAIGEKKALQVHSALVFSLVLSLFNTVLSIPFLLFADFSTVSFAAIAILFFKSIFGAIAFLFIMNGLKKMELSSSLPLLALTPGVTAILAFVFLKESITHAELAGMLILLIGTYVLQLKINESLLAPFKIMNHPKALMYIMAAVLIFAITSVVDKVLLVNYKLPPLLFIPIQHLFILFFFTILFLFRKSKFNETPEIQNTWKLFLLIAVFTLIYRFSHIYAVKLGAVALVLSIKRSSVFFATVIGGSYFKESNLLRKTIATVLLIVGAILIINS